MVRAAGCGLSDVARWGWREARQGGGQAGEPVPVTLAFALEGRPRSARGPLSLAFARQPPWGQASEEEIPLGVQLVFEFGEQLLVIEFKFELKLHYYIAFVHYTVGTKLNECRHNLPDHDSD